MSGLCTAQQLQVWLQPLLETYDTKFASKIALMTQNLQVISSSFQLIISYPVTEILNSSDQFEAVIPPIHKHLYLYHPPNLLIKYFIQNSRVA